MSASRREEGRGSGQSDSGEGGGEYGDTHSLGSAGLMMRLTAANLRVFFAFPIVSLSRKRGKEWGREEQEAQRLPKTEIEIWTGPASETQTLTLLLTSSHVFYSSPRRVLVLGRRTPAPVPVQRRTCVGQGAPFLSCPSPPCLSPWH